VQRKEDLRACGGDSTVLVAINWARCLHPVWQLLGSACVIGGHDCPSTVTKIGKRKVCYSFAHTTPLRKPGEGNVVVLRRLEKVEASKARSGVVNVTMKGNSSSLCATKGKNQLTRKSRPSRDAVGRGRTSGFLFPLATRGHRWSALRVGFPK
jgi:hypothetical protein